MRKFWSFFLLIFSFLTVCGIELMELDYVTVESSKGIVVQTTSFNSEQSSKVVLKNSNRCNPPEITTNVFEYYLSFKGQRISDYYNAAIRCEREQTYQVYFWPDTVKAGQEKYITVQFGREPQKPVKKDSRDDD